MLIGGWPLHRKRFHAKFHVFHEEITSYDLQNYNFTFRWNDHWENTTLRRNDQLGEMANSVNWPAQKNTTFNEVFILSSSTCFQKSSQIFGEMTHSFFLFSLCNPSHAWQQQQQHSIKRWGKYGKLRRVGRGSRWSVNKSRVSSQRIARIHTADEVLDELRESEEWTRKWAYAGRVRRLNATLWDVGWVGSGWWCCCVYTQIHLWLAGEVGSSTSIERYSSWASLAKWR